MAPECSVIFHLGLSDDRMPEPHRQLPYLLNGKSGRQEIPGILTQ